VAPALFGRRRMSGKRVKKKMEEKVVNHSFRKIIDVLSSGELGVTDDRTKQD
jgi:hypothetical protein